MTSLMRFSFAATVAAAFVAAATPLAAQTFGYSVPDNGIAPFGMDSFNMPTFNAIAQSFQTPVGSPLLESFSFFLSDNFQGADLQVQAGVYEFTGSSLGAALYTSGVVAGSGNSADYDPITVSGVHILLTPGTLYALVLRTAASSPDGHTDIVGTTQAETFSLGQLFVSEGSTDAELRTAGAFTMSNAQSYGTDVAIQATFGPAGVTATPEPATFALFATGLAGVGMVARRRRRAPV